MRIGDINVGDMYVIRWNTSSSGWLVIGKTTDHFNVWLTVLRCWSDVSGERPIIVSQHSSSGLLSRDVTVFREGHVINAGEIVS